MQNYFVRNPDVQIRQCNECIRGISMNAYEYNCLLAMTLIPMQLYLNTDYADADTDFCTELYLFIELNRVQKLKLSPTLNAKGVLSLCNE